MPKCSKCNRSTFDGTRWKSQTNHPEFNGKYLCDACISELSIGSKSAEEQIQKESKSPSNECCVKCGKELRGYWEKFPTVGVIANRYPMFAGRKLCEGCRSELMNSPPSKAPDQFSSNVVVKLSEDINRAILWQKDEVLKDHFIAKEFFEDRTVALGARVGHNGCLVVTNQRILFACKVGMLASAYSLMYAINLEDVMSASHGRFGFNDKLIILDKNGQHRDYVQTGIQSLISSINKAVTERKNFLQSKSDRERVQIVLNFSSLKDVMTKGGLVMTSYKCPNCNGMVKLPEEGKVLVCEYCGTPIKPVDIFEKIKALIT